MKKKTMKQGQRFIAAAKEHGCDDSEKDFNEKLRRIAKPKKKGKPAK